MNLKIFGKTPINLPKTCPRKISNIKFATLVVVAQLKQSMLATFNNRKLLL
jgi:hypothetical protein